MNPEQLQRVAAQLRESASMRTVVDYMALQGDTLCEKAQWFHQHLEQMTLGMAEKHKPVTIIHCHPEIAIYMQLATVMDHEKDGTWCAGEFQGMKVYVDQRAPLGAVLLAGDSDNSDDCASATIDFCNWSLVYFTPN